MFRVIVIDPRKKTVEERYIISDDNAFADQIREIIGDGFSSAGFIVPRDGVGNILYVDDEGLFKDNLFFALLGWGHEAYAGIGVLCGSDGRGETVSANLSIEEVKTHLVFL